MLHYKSAALAALLLFVVPLQAEPAPLFAAMEARDIGAIEALRQNAATPDLQTLANGAALSLHRKDEAAIAALKPLAKASADAEIRAAAWLALSDIYLRQGRFAETYAAMKAGQKLSKQKLDADTLQTMEMMRVLRREAPMRLEHAASGRLEITRDMVGMLRIPVKINGHSESALVDSGAAFTTMSESAAKRLGVRVLDQAVSVGSSTKHDVANRLGVAKSLAVGDAVLSNVMIIVLPDEALTFLNGQYKVGTIIGVPVCIELGRIEVAQEAGSEAFYYGPRPAAVVESNLLLANIAPLVLIQADKASGPLRLFLDTGANATMLNASVLKEYPELGAAAVTKAARWAGAGGETTDEKAQNLPELKLSLAGKAITLNNVSVVSEARTDRHGVIGQDVLKAGKRWALDFNAMSFVVSD